MTREEEEALFYEAAEKLLGAANALRLAGRVNLADAAMGLMGVVQRDHAHSFPPTKAPPPVDVH